MVLGEFPGVWGLWVQARARDWILTVSKDGRISVGAEASLTPWPLLKYVSIYSFSHSGMRHLLLMLLGTTMQVSKSVSFFGKI